MNGLRRSLEDRRRLSFGEGKEAAGGGGKALSCNFWRSQPENPNLASCRPTTSCRPPYPASQPPVRRPPPPPTSRAPPEDAHSASKKFLRPAGGKHVGATARSSSPSRSRSRPRCSPPHERRLRTVDGSARPTSGLSSPLDWRHAVAGTPSEAGPRVPSSYSTPNALPPALAQDPNRCHAFAPKFLRSQAHARSTPGLETQSNFATSCVAPGD